jgi:hypothetical protein
VNRYCRCVTSIATIRSARRLVVFAVIASTGVLGTLGSVAAQVDEGETQIINIRETDGRLGPLVYTLIGLGCASLLATIGFWWLTRPRRENLQTDPSFHPNDN